MASKNTPKKKPARPKVNKIQLTEKERKVRDRCLEEIKNISLPDHIEDFSMWCVSYYEGQLLYGNTLSIPDCFGTTVPLNKELLQDMFWEYEDGDRRHIPSKTSLYEYCREWLYHTYPDKKNILDTQFRYDPNKNGYKSVSQVIAEQYLTKGHVSSIKHCIAREIPFTRWLSYLGENTNYPYAKKYAVAVHAVSDYDSRSYQRPTKTRKFILDVGPTNSGKTYSGMQELMGAKSGVYLGPLRLLAMEAADTLNDAGTPCSMLTGEEHHEIQGAHHIASTVEMLDRAAHYEVAVIDECQMITDPERGYAWAGAITSISADVIHLCLAPEAEKLITNMLDGLDEEYEIVYHDRLVPLVMDESVAYPKGIQKGDALIVFSRKKVQEYATDLERHGFKTSMVYGALPYKVRKEEVRKFAEGETDVVVATDAIGMGLNLPVKRVVFAETEKYDGKHTRILTDGEIKQIAGRAGRFGKYDTGYVSVLRGEKHELISRALTSEIECITEIRVDIPYHIIEIQDVPLAYLLRAWQMNKLSYPYVKRDMNTSIRLARRVSDLPNEFVYSACEIPFKSGDRYVPLDDIWERTVRSAYHGGKFKLELYGISPDDRLQRLEDAAKIADLAYGLAKRYGSQRDMDEIDSHRAMIAAYMIETLRVDKKKKQKICKYCGEALPDGFKYKMHDECYEEYKGFVSEFCA